MKTPWTILEKAPLLVYVLVQGFVFLMCFILVAGVLYSHIAEPDKVVTESRFTLIIAFFIWANQLLVIKNKNQ